jgi:hypothetical protein
VIGGARQSLDQKNTENLTQSRKGAKVKTKTGIAAKGTKTHKKEDFKSVRRDLHCNAMDSIETFWVDGCTRLLSYDSVF